MKRNELCQFSHTAPSFPSFAVAFYIGCHRFDLTLMMKNFAKTLKAVLLVGVAGMLVAAEAGDAPAVQPNQQRADKPLEQQVLGYWVPNWEAMAEKWKPMIKDLAQFSPGLDSKEKIAEAEKKVADEMKEGFQMTTMEFTKDKYLQHTGEGRVNAQSYVVKKVDAKAGTIEVELLLQGRETPERAKFILAGDRLTFIGEQEARSAPYILDRSDKREFEKRQAAAAKSKLFNATGSYQGPDSKKTPERKKPVKSKP